MKKRALLPKQLSFLLPFLSSVTRQTLCSCFWDKQGYFSLVLPHWDIYQGAPHIFIHPSVKIHFKWDPRNYPREPRRAPNKWDRGLLPLLCEAKVTVRHPKILVAPLAVKPTSDVHWVFTAKPLQDLCVRTAAKKGSHSHLWDSSLL